jgi:Zn-dependent peptidase ImmA (M78 family)
LLNSEFRPHFQFRAKATLKPDQKSAIDHALLDASQQIHFVDTVTRMTKKASQPFGIKADMTFPQLPRLANQFRETLKLNRRVTLDEFKQALAERDILVFEWRLPWHLSGLSFRGPFTVIIINFAHTPKRRLFTLAHEFAHVLFHLDRGHEDTAVSIASCQDPQEKEANAFAAEFLVPTADLRAYVDSLGSRLKEPGHLDAVAREFNVSREALFYRLVQLKFFKWPDKHRYSTGEFLPPKLPEIRVDDIENQVAPAFLQDAISLHQSAEVSAGKLAEWFFSTRLTTEDYLASLSRDQENGLLTDPNHEEKPAKSP